MTTAFRTTISDLAATFANAVITAIRGANLEDILELANDVDGKALRSHSGRARGKAPALGAVPRGSKSGRGASQGRLQRRSPEDIAKALDQVVALVKANKGGLRAEQIREKLGMEAREMPRVLKEGLANKVLKSKGQKRSTTYSAA
jgi:hypothetical protein